MSLHSLMIRFPIVVALMVWVGGFTFYGAVVIPVLHDELDHLQAGRITQRVTDLLNLIGVVALSTCWLAVGFDARSGTFWTRRAWLSLLVADSALLAFLIVLHQIMDRRLATTGLRDFYPLHRTYLITSTIQWVINLALISLLVVIMTMPPSPDAPPDRDIERGP